MMSTYLLGIDIGTSSCKAALFDPDGKVVATAGADYPVYYPNEGWAEQDADDWWRGVCAAVRTLTEKVSPADIAGVGLDGQSWSAIPIDKDKNVLCRTPIWMDMRAQAQCDRATRAIGFDTIFGCCGNPLKPSYTLPKILWYKDERPGLYARADKILQSNAYIAMKLTGMISQDKSQGYGLACYDMRRDCWDDALVHDFGIDRGLLPDICDCHSVIGKVTREAAALTGLAEGTPVVAGGLDAACGTLGAGVIANGQTQEQGGQAGGMSVCIESYAAHPALILSRHVVPDRWLLQGGSVGGGAALKWMREQLCASDDFNTMGAMADTIPAGSEGVIFLPYMSGERSPIWDAQAKGMFYGLDYGKTRAHMIRAVMEGVAFALKHNLEYAEAAGARVTEMYAVGGAANSRVWTQLKADATGCVMHVPASDTATTLGAAILAGVGTGVYADFDEAVRRCVRVERTHTPNPEHRSVYEKNYRAYRGLYEAVRAARENW